MGRTPSRYARRRLGRDARSAGMPDLRMPVRETARETPLRPSRCARPRRAPAARQRDCARVRA